MLDGSRPNSRPLSLLVALSWSLSLLGAACAPDGFEEDELEAEDDSLRRDDAIIGGDPATDYPEAVLVDLSQNGQPVGLCSGSLIAPTVVLTAGHCVYGYDGWTVTAPFANGQTATATSWATYDWTNTGNTVDPNQHDLGLVFLSSPITLPAYPTIATSKLPDGSLVSSIGRIDDGQASFTELFLAPAVPVEDGSSVGYPLDYKTVETIQHGDSGGPVVADGTHEIVAVNSGGGGGVAVLARTDLLATWIADQVAAASNGNPPPPSNPPPNSPPPNNPPPNNPPPNSPPSGCGSVTYEGECQGEVVVWCEDGELYAYDCGEGGMTCGFVDSMGLYDCQ
jgi:hypothetical protein